MEYEIKSHNKFTIGIKELWSYRELFIMFTWRDIKVKYKQTFLGVAWAIFQPILMTLLFTFSFGSIISEKSNLNVPYSVFALSGFILWNIFSTGLTNSGNSMVNNSNIIKKIYFPRLIIPFSSVLVSLIDFIMAFLIFIPLLYYYNHSFKLSALWLIPCSIILTCISTFGLGTLISAANVKYRDFRYILPFFIQAMLFATPVIYPLNISGNKFFQLLLEFNPMYAPIELFRHSFLSNELNLHGILYSCLSSIFTFIIGIFYFRKTESYFADLA
ncbi:MAG: ABC transporter permease [Sphingobacteriaceae bacterium]|nr:ABC transporter permease [Sphingobacteriaceae bacterium]